MAPLSSLRPLAKWSAAAILLMAVCVAGLLYKDSLLRVPLPKTASTQGSGDEFPSVTPFTNIAPAGLHPDSEIWNDRPGVAVFDFDRDGDLDFYVTSEGGRANRLYQNDGNGRFKDVATNANVEAEADHSTGVAACDFDNDGFQDLYVGGRGDPLDGLDFRSPSEGQGNVDRLFRNKGDGTFADVTVAAFGDDVNLRSASSVACADVDLDGWLDIYIGNLAAQDYRTLDSPSHPGHRNVLYLNNQDGTFKEVAESAGVEGPQVFMRDPEGMPLLFRDTSTGEMFEGYDPNAIDVLENRIGEATGQTHAVLFFDYDDDGDPDLWVANDGDRLHVFRNDSSGERVQFTPVGAQMEVDSVGSWMGFAVGDYDSDADLDVFVTNIGYHPRLFEASKNPKGTCEYHDQFQWGTCLHFLLRNDGGRFTDVAGDVRVVADRFIPPSSVDPTSIYRTRTVPTGLGAYDFGFGTTFFDYDNDGAQDLYWLGGLTRGEGPGGHVYPSPGRMLQGDGAGYFRDITVAAHLLDIADVNYVDLERKKITPSMARVSLEFHENGKGLAHGDLNGDGFVDLIGTNSSGDVFTDPERVVPGSTKTRFTSPLQQMTSPVRPAPGPLFVWINGGGPNHWITLRLLGRMAIDGTGSNADGIGARVMVKTRIAGSPTSLVQVQEVRAGSSYLSMDSIELEFGLGTATTIDEISIRWPSRRTQTLQNVAADRVLTVTEPAQ